MKIFVSYSRSDTKYVKPLVDVIRATRPDPATVFYDQDSIIAGEKWRPQTDDALQEADKLLLFWCAHSAKSQEVRREWQMCLKHGIKIEPVLLDDTELPDELAEYQYTDIRGIASIGHRYPWFKTSLAVLGGVTFVAAPLLWESSLVLALVSILASVMFVYARRRAKHFEKEICAAIALRLYEDAQASSVSASIALAGAGGHAALDAAKVLGPAALTATAIVAGIGIAVVSQQWESSSGVNDASQAVGSAAAADDGAIENASSAMTADTADELALSSQSGAVREMPVRTGKDIYQKVCVSCHGPGIAGAPKLGDVEAWAPRLSKGEELLLQTLIGGMLPQKPPGSFCEDCSDAELAGALNYMITASRRDSEE